LPFPGTLGEGLPEVGEGGMAPGVRTSSPASTPLTPVLEGGSPGERNSARSKEEVGKRGGLRVARGAPGDDGAYAELVETSTVTSVEDTMARSDGELAIEKVSRYVNK
jgi:hypothetical protein